MLKEKYSDWFNLTADIVWSDSLEHAYEVGEEAWNYKNARLQELIEGVESIPTSAACYITVDEAIAASRVKQKVLEILRGEQNK